MSINLATRLGKIAPTLTGKERAMAALAAERAGQEPDPKWRLLMPRDQVTEYNRLVALSNVANCTLGTYCLAVALRIESLASFVQVLTWMDEAGRLVAEDLAEEVDARKVRAWHKAATVTVPVFLKGLAFDVRHVLRQEALGRWQELRCLELVWAEIAEQFDGEDQLRPGVKQIFDDARAQLITILTGAGLSLRKLPEPGAAMLEEFRQRVEDDMRAFGLLEVP